MDNHLYNLMKAATKKAQSVWRYDQYIQDSAGCQECQKLWKKLKQADSAHLEELKKVLSSHIKSGALQ